MDLTGMYDAIMELQAILEKDHDEQELGRPDYRKVQALAATYTLQEYLANEPNTKPAALTLEELKDIGHGAHIWVKIKTEKPMFGREEPFATIYIAAAVTDELDEVGIVALWSADPLNPMLVEKDYGVSWWAYQSDPREDDE